MHKGNSTKGRSSNGVGSGDNTAAPGWLQHLSAFHIHLFPPRAESFGTVSRLGATVAFVLLDVLSPLFLVFQSLQVICFLLSICLKLPFTTPEPLCCHGCGLVVWAPRLLRRMATWKCEFPLVQTFVLRSRICTVARHSISSYTLKDGISSIGTMRLLTYSGMTLWIVLFVM